MQRRKNVVWASFLVSGLLLATLSACNNDEPAATTGTPAPAAAPEAAPITGATPSPTALSPEVSSTETKNKEKDKPKDNSTVTAPKPLAATKPLEKGEIKEDKPLPAEDVKVKPIPEKPKPALVQGGLSESQLKAMKTALDDAKKEADAGKIDDAVTKYNEFAGGTWPEAEKELKTKSADKHGAIEAAIKVADEAGKSKDKAKLSKALTDLLAAVEKAK